MSEDLVGHDVRPEGNAELLRRSARRDPGAIALQFGERSWTYAQLWDAVRAYAAELTDLGIGLGDRAAVLGRNSDRYVIAWLASQLLGAVHVPVNFMLSAREVGYIVAHSGATLALADPELEQTMRDGVAQAGSEPPLGAQALAQIAYTSGTESSPKGAMLSHGSLQAQYASCIVAGEYSSDDVFIHALPLYHCAQMHCFMMPALALGARGVVLGAPTPAAMLDAIAAHGVTSVFTDALPKNPSGKILKRELRTTVGGG